MKPFAIMMTGIPASGKSTLRESLVRRLTMFGPVVVAPDDLIESVAEAADKFYRDIYTSPCARAVCYDAALYRFDEAVRNQQHLILDRTYLTREQRTKAFARFRSNPYRHISVTVDLPPDIPEWIGRLDGRIGKEIPPSTLFKMIRSMELPNEDEGFEKLFFGRNSVEFEDQIITYIREITL